MFTRNIVYKLTQAVKSFYATALIGPRQSGKTTLLRALFPDYHYINLEEPDTRLRVQTDPRTFFADEHKNWIIDEAQEYPELFSFLLGFIDRHKRPGQFILSGSKNFLLLEKISQSLAGRIAILELLPLSYTELSTADTLGPFNLWQILYQGSYPGPIYQKIDTALWYKSYITTYLERDVRQMIQVKDLNKFHLFLKLCAGRHGQLLNLSQLGSDCGISHTTAHEWITLLEASYIATRLMPFYKNINKRLVKSPKLYFLDSGLVCHLLGIESSEHLQLHASRGAIFEGYIVTEVIKEFYAKVKEPPIYFCKLYSGSEIDLLIDTSSKTTLIEIKSSATFNSSFLKQLHQFKSSDYFAENTEYYLLYAGDETFKIKDVTVLSWQEIATLV